jgi:chromosomal replication initiation ATPase DnaA
MFTERRIKMAHEMRTLADWLGEIDDPTVGRLPDSHWDLMSTVLNAFCPMPEPAHVVKVSADLVLSEVSLQMGVTVPVMLSESRKQHVAFVRQVAMYLCRRMTERSFPDIGVLFGRDHATVIYAIRMIAKRVEQDRVFAHTIDKIAIVVMRRARAGDHGGKPVDRNGRFVKVAGGEKAA